MSDEREQRIKAELFGTVRRAKATGGHAVKRENLLEPLDGPLQNPPVPTVMHSFCVGCGFYLEITQERAEELAEMAGIILPYSLHGYYFETHSCSLCDSTNPLVTLKKIPPQ
jgi:hypothetical protein